jgi:hypothetical protein
MLKHILGWKTSRKIIVFESDDWGSFSFKNQQIRDKYIQNYDTELWMYNNDAFESFEDLKQLSHVLTSTVDKNQNTACFTFLLNPANPDFDKIEEANFENYYYESFAETLKKRKDGKQILDWYHKSIKEKRIEVGFHGREHLNPRLWMKHLKLGNKIALRDFKDRTWGFSKLNQADVKSSYRSTFKIESYDELDDLKINIKEGVELMNTIFNQKTRYFLPPDGPYHLNLNKTLADNGIKFIGLAKLHNNPLEPKLQQKKLFWLGKQTKENLTVITRNVIFEPASPRYIGVDSAIQQIEKAFAYKNPAVISTHRANYGGTLNPNNRTNSLSELKILLDKISKKWPQVEFLTSSKLGQIIDQNKHAQ